MFSAAFPAGTILAAILVLIPLPSHWRARNVATLSLIGWLFVMNLIYAVNSFVWSDNSQPRLLVWCDITTKLMIGASSAIPAAALCICKYLELVASGRVVRLMHDDHRRRRIFELAMCILVPVVLMALHYVVQGHRFDIVEAIGCQPATYYSVPAVFIVWFPPLLLSTITFVYAALALYHFFRQRITFAAALSSSGSSLNTSRYLRLMAMSITEMAWGTSLTAVTMYDNIAPGLRPWTNWADVHSNFGRIATFRLFMIPPGYLRQIFVMWWAMPVSAYIFFLFFAFGEESVRDYKRVYTWVKTKVLRRPVIFKRAQFGSLSGSNSLPSQLIVHKQSTIDVRGDSDDDNTLPSYTPQLAHGAPFITPTSSKFPSSTDTKYMDRDLEKNMDFITVKLHSDDEDEDTAVGTPHTLRSPHSPHTPHTPYSCYSITSHVSTSSTDHRISISDEFPASRPPTPLFPIPTRESRQQEWYATMPASPPYHRPFTPPTVVQRSSEDGASVVPSIDVSIHRNTPIDRTV
ncbi:unnamed protein product [Somion occarium]|uniref:Pheromone receptor n=1 Tax=Somion occarium TaxID=3059160 RepID=A0ABP1CPG2_9APHY